MRAQGPVTLDAVVVGGGPNGLAAAITLARYGLAVRLIEADDRVGGGLATAELTEPGYLHDVCSAIHPLGAGSPLLRSLPLERHGLDWVHPEVCLAHPLASRPAATLSRSLDETAAGLEADGDGYRRLFAAALGSWASFSVDLLGPPLDPAAAARLVRWAWPAAGSATSLIERAAVTLRGRALVAGLAAHSILPLDRSPSAGVALVLAAAGHAAGWPAPRGGAGRLADALASVFGSLGGEIETGRRVRSLLDLPPARATLLDLGPGPAGRLLRDHAPARYLRQLAAYPYGPGAFKLDWALSDPIPWRDPACARAGTVHLGGTFEEIRASERAVWRGSMPERPFVLLSEPTRFDPSRAPAGRGVAWGYCHVPRGFDGDATPLIEAQIERFAPGFRDCVTARAAHTPADLEARNPNLVGGDVGGGALSLRRVLSPVGLRADPYATALPGVFLCSAATPPGAGVHGMCGYHAARSVLRTLFGVRAPRDPARARGSRSADQR